MNFTPVILAEAAASGGSTTSAMLSMLITFVPLFAVFYFLIVIKPRIIILIRNFEDIFIHFFFV